MFKYLNFGAKSILKQCVFGHKSRLICKESVDTQREGCEISRKKVGKNLFTVIFSLSEEEIVDNSKVPLSHVKLFTFGYSMARVKTVVTLS